MSEEDKLLTPEEKKINEENKALLNELNEIIENYDFDESSKEEYQKYINDIIDILLKPTKVFKQELLLENLEKLEEFNKEKNVKF